MIKQCVVCGKEFKCSPSDKIVTCSKECSRINKSRTHIGKSNTWTEESRKKLSEQGVTANLKKGTEAAKKSPKSGRFETNINAHGWHIVSPERNHYIFRNLFKWARENCDLFGLEKTEANAKKIARGILHAKAGTLGKPYANTCTYKGWEVIISEKRITEFGKYKDCDLSLLGQKEREYLKLLMGGLDYRDISQLYNISENTVRVMACNARMKLEGRADAMIERNRAFMKEYQKAYPEKAAETRKKNYQKNREKRIADMKNYNKEYYRKNREKILEKANARRQSKKISPES